MLPFRTFVRFPCLLLLTLLNACGPGAAEQAVRDGEAAFGQMDFTAAIEHFTTALNHDPDNVRAYQGRGAAYFAANRFDEATSDLDRAIALDGSLGWAYFYRGSSRMHLGRFEEAAQDLDRAVRSGQLPEQDVGRAHRNRSIAHMNLEQYEDAIGDLTRAIALEPGLPLNYHDRAMLYEAVGDTTSAIDDYEAYLALNAEGSRAQEIREQLALLRAPSAPSR